MILTYKSVVAASKDLPIDFVDWQDDISSHLRDLKLVVVPSGPMEATTRVILEAFAFGVPVVAFPSGGIPEILIDGENGFLARDVTPAALAERMQSVLRLEPSELARVAANARKSWHSRFTLRSYREQVCDIVTSKPALLQGFDNEGTHQTRRPLRCTELAMAATMNTATITAAIAAPNAPSLQASKMVSGNASAAPSSNIRLIAESISNESIVCVPKTLISAERRGRGDIHFNTLADGAKAGPRITLHAG